MFKLLKINLLVFLSFSLNAQQRGNDGKVLMLDFTYAYHLPVGDLSDRFGGNMSVGGGLDYLTKTNFLLGAQFNGHFGNEVKEDVLSLIRSEEGLIFGNIGFPADVLLRERGLYLGGHIGKLFPMMKFNNRSGIRATVGVGLFQHKVRIQDDPQVGVSLLEAEYKKGFDRLTNGLAITEFIGYQHLARNRRINFYAGFEFTQAFTQNRRTLNYDTMTKDESSRFDGLVGFKFGWILPFYLEDNPDEIFY